MSALIAEQTNEIAAAAAFEAASAHKGVILIVEDEQELAEVLEYNLERRGFKILVAHDGLTACRLVGLHRPDLILLDILLPDLDGWEICRLIRGHQSSAIAMTPILMMTALGTQEDKIKGLQLGADAFIPKPYSVREVCLRAERMVASRKQHLQARDAAEAERERMAVDIQSLLLHELRNHLLIITGFSQLLTQGMDEPDSERLHRYARSIDRSAQYLSNLSNDFMLVRQVEDQGLVLPTEPCRLDAVIADMVTLFAEPAREKGIVFEGNWMEGAWSAMAHHAALRVVLSSLLDNAVKYSDAPSAVRIRLGEDGADAVIEIADQGCGISDGEKDRVFERFFRGEGSGAKVPGSGLGLYIAKTLVQAMGGAIRAEREPGGGTCMQVRIPADPRILQETR